MQKILTRPKVDLSLYASDISSPKAKYGLPTEVKFCKKCVISNQRPNSAVEYKHTQRTQKSTINFDEAGVCDACRTAEKKRQQIDWEKREEKLQELCNRYRRNDGSYDCLIPGSGGKDSFYASHILKTKYNMHPLTVTWAPHIYTDWGYQNFQSWIHAGFDNYCMTPNGKVHRLLTRLALENLFHPFQPFIFGQKTLAPKLAKQFNIPLVIYGENEAEYGNPIQENDSSLREKKYFSTKGSDQLFLGGTSVSDLVNYFGLEPADLLPYLPPDENELNKSNVEVHYLGYYLPWHPQSCYYYAVEHGGFIPAPERTPGTYSKYNSIDDKIDDFHYYTTLIKFGIGRATYDASQEIRSGDITREEGVNLVKRFDTEFPERFSDKVYKYLSISKEEYPVASNCFEQPIIDSNYFTLLTDSYRSPHLWKFTKHGWQLRTAVWHENKVPNLLDT